MTKLRIMRIKNNSYYVLLDENTEKIYTLIFEFHLMEYPNVNDYIIFDEKLLNPKFEGFAQPYALRPIEQNEIETTDQIDIFVLESNNKNTMLKRIYG